MAAIVVTGIKEVDRRLRELGPKVGNKVVRRALRQAIRPLQAATRAEAPTGETGALERSVLVRAGRRSRAKISVLVLIGNRAFKAPKFYAAFREFGTKKMRANDYMKRAFDHAGGAVRDAALALIRAGIEREA